MAPASAGFAETSNPVSSSYSAFMEAQQIHSIRLQMQAQAQQGNPYQQRRW